MRVSFDEGVRLFSDAPLEELRERAMALRWERCPAREVTFILDSNPNYTNVCKYDCSFCAFYRKEGAADAYTKSVEEVMEHLAFARRAGLSTVLLQGGVNDALPLEYYTTLLREARARYPDIFPHFFSAPEIWNLSRISGLSLVETFCQLKDAGLRTLPGGGAEILSERVRARISKKKMEPGAWIATHRAAHECGLKTSATMMYGHVETAEDVVTHLEALRGLQDATGGFTAFVPWSYKYTNTALGRVVKSWAGSDAYLRVLAFARIYLDNFDHIQGSWYSEGKMTGIAALHHGADDFGGILVEENVHKETGFVHHIDHRGIVGLIREAGFEPVQRNPLYEVLRRYEGVVDVEVPEAQRATVPDALAILGGAC